MTYVEEPIFPQPGGAGPRQPDLINHPPHYTSAPAKCSGCGKAIECIDITRHMMFDPGNVVKYVWRRVFGNKTEDGNVEGLRKAVWYLQDEIKRLEGEWVRS